MPLPRPDALLAVPLLLVGGWLGALSDDLRTTPRPPAGVSRLLGGFSAIAVQVLWIRGDGALRVNRLDEALYYFSLIHRLEPQLVGATEYFANEITANLGDREPDPAARAHLTLLAVRMLDRTVRGNPDRAEAFVTRGSFLLARIGPFEERAAAFRADRGTSVYAAARTDFRRALELAPTDRQSAFGYAVSSRMRGMELFAEAAARGDERALRVAGTIFADAASAYETLIVLQQEAFRGTGERLEQEREQMLRAESVAWAAFLAGPLDDLRTRYREFHAAAGAPGEWPAPW